MGYCHLIQQLKAWSTTDAQPVETTILNAQPFWMFKGSTHMQNHILFKKVYGGAFKMVIVPTSYAIAVDHTLNAEIVMILLFCV